MLAEPTEPPFSVQRRPGAGEDETGARDSGEQPVPDVGVTVAKHDRDDAIVSDGFTGGGERLREPGVVERRRTVVVARRPPS